MSAKINWTDAIEMIEAYQNNSVALKSEPQNGCEIIRGYKFDKSDIQDILDDSNTEEVLIVPAVTKADLSKPENEQTFTMIIVGLDSRGVIVTATATDYSPPVLNNTPNNYPYISTC